MHLVAATTDEGTVVVFMGTTATENVNQNLEIFRKMHESFQFK